MAQNSNPISETLKKIYRHWTEKQISDLTAHIFATYGNLIEKKGDDSAVLELLHMAIMEARKAYPNAEQVNPGLIRRILPQQLDRQNDKETKRIDNKTLEDAETFVHRVSGRPDFDLDKYREKLDRLEKYVLRACGLTPTEEKLFRIWMEVVKRETKSDSDSIFGTKGISIDLMDELQDEVRNSGWDISNEYFRKLLSDIRGKLRIKKPEIGGLMSFIQTADADLEELKALLIEQLDFTLKTNINLTAYRFSDEELDKMMWLKKLFTDNGFSFEPNRFPEVYYDDFNKVKEQYPEIKSDQDGTPDYLGVYIYHLKGGASKEPCRKSKEGIIVLLRDRIENYRRIPTDDLRFAVLMHELGHWLSHWTYKKGYNWSIGYHLTNDKTHEVFAQLFAYWACKDNPRHLEALIALSPKKVRQFISNEAHAEETAESLIDTEKTYGRYWLLKDRAYSSILEKLHQIREGWMLKDDVMIEFLKKEGEDDIEKWLRSLEDFTQEKISSCEISILHCGGNVSDRFVRLLEPDEKKANAIIFGRKYGISTSTKWYE